MSRVFVLVLDSLGLGGAPDAHRFGDEGSNTLLHIAQACAAGQADGAQRRGPLRLTQLSALGLSRALALACDQGLPGDDTVPRAAWAAANELSRGKDTPSGHWEMMGVPVEEDWGYFSPGADGRCFPPALLQAAGRPLGIGGWLGDCHTSGTEIIARLGQRHVETGWPIVYTSADSVVQIACHESAFGLQRLYQLCESMRREVDALRIGRVIARPFAGSGPDGFQRTARRRDYAMPPPAPTLLERIEAAGGHTIAVGKVADIFAHRGIGTAVPAYGHEALMQATLAQVREAPDGSLTMCNFVDFDQLFGHRRDLAGYAQALEHFDALLPELLSTLQPDDLLLISADHGCDPSWPGTDHTRERVPLLAWGHRVQAGSHGVRDSFADLGQTAANWLGLPPLPHGQALALGRAPA